MQSLVSQRVHFNGSKVPNSHVIQSSYSGPKFTGPLSPNAGGIALVRMSFRFWMLPRSEDIRDQISSGTKLTEISHVLAPIFLEGGGRGEGSVPRILNWTCIIKFSRVSIMWQGFMAIGRSGPRRTHSEKEKTRWAGQSPMWGRPAPQFRVQNQFE